MARIKLPSYLKEGSGRMEDAVLVTRNGRSYMMAYRKVEHPATVKQTALRNAFCTVVSDWKYLRGIIAASWGSMPENRSATGYNLYLGRNISRRRDGEPVILCPGMGMDMLINFTAEPGACAGAITCTFLPAGPGCHVSFFSRKETAPGENSVITRHDAGAAPVSPFTITGLEPGAQYHIWALVTDAAYDEATTVSASVAAVTKSAS